MTEIELSEQNAKLEAENSIATVQESDFNTQLKVAAKLLGYKRMPPDIITFIEDPYYLGELSKNLYPFWKEKLKEIFPTPIHTRYPILVLTGSIGSGKSTFTRICAMYMICRLDHLINPHKTMGMIGGKKIVFNFLMPTSTTAEIEFPGTMRNWMKLSPYFRDDMYNGMSPYELCSEGLIGKGRIGRDVIFYGLSELNFLPKHRAKDKLDTALKRWSSRFQRFIDYFGMVIIDTSSKNDDSIADEFIANNPYEDKVLAIRTREWTVKKNFNYYFRSGSFWVYCGDSLHAPFIVPDNEDHTKMEGYDPERFLEVPMELKAEFEFGLEKALTDKAGISVSMTDKFIQDPEGIKKCFKIPLHHPETLDDLDFFDTGDKIIYYLEDQLRLVPDDKIVFIHYDLGITGDRAGLAMSYFDSWVEYGKTSDNKLMKLPKIVVPVAVGIGRRKDQETSIFKMQEFVIDMFGRNELYFSADQFCSRQLFQNLTMLGIKNNYVSVDRTDAAYVYVKTLMINDIISLPNSKLLRTEFSELRRVGRKIDHPSTGSKDVSDAVAGSVLNLYNHLDAAGQLSIKYRINKHIEELNKRADPTKDQYNKMLKNIFGD